jgi:HPt (histidine-containing phosphotransfer) domain-containing protein
LPQNFATETALGCDGLKKAQAMPAQLFDRDHFGHMTGQDIALQREILGMFRDQSDLWRRLLIADAPVHTWRDAAHTLKGSARGLGFWALAEACETAEQLAQSGLRDGPLVAHELAAVRARLDEALALVDETLADAAAH